MLHISANILVHKNKLTQFGIETGGTQTGILPDCGLRDVMDN